MLRIGNSHFELLYPNSPSHSNKINTLLTSELPPNIIRNIATNMRQLRNTKKTISSNMRNITLSNKKPFASLKQNANKPKRKKPLIAPETNEEIARRLQLEENQTLKQQENNEALARRLQAEENKASKK
jgi:hypothetical protein